MTTFSQNRFAGLLGDEEAEMDKLGNVKQVEKKDEPLSRREVVSRRLHNSAAVSPPSRRERSGRGSDKADETEKGVPNGIRKGVGGAAASRHGGAPGGPRGRQFDRRSGTGILDNEKKINQGWGRLGTAEREAADDVLEPRDPAAEGEPQPSISHEREENVKTLDEYRASQKSASDKLRLPQARKANEGVDDSQWKGAVPLSRTEEDSLYSGKETSMKAKIKSKKEKVFLEIEHQPTQRGGRGGRGGRGSHDGRRGRGRGRDKGRANDINLLDANMFPTLGA
ncbi:hypothetical protein DFQ28_000292 [Apophysomyces sp. BC1034]|nr:hypothetical protein DFQ30_008103 [Apophysomyces sp. BC1015]KAG0191406.1 hypothetical protein DFQ28_000292 [Apophysomyces sp. BC1034]